MFATVLKDLDAWMIEENDVLRAGDLQPNRACTIHLFGQTALLESSLGIPLVATQDVDVYVDYEYSVKKKFEDLLGLRNLLVVPAGHEAWMPEETIYECCYDGSYVTGHIAHPDFVLLSKALKAPVKNNVLLTDYLALGATERFVALAEKYNVDLELFL